MTPQEVLTLLAKTKSNANVLGFENIGLFGF